MRKNDFTGGAIQSANKNWIGVVSRGESFKVPYSEVLYIEQAGKNLRIQKEVDIIHISGRISKISEVVGEPFYQCHSYLLINLSKVRVMTNGVIIFDNKMSTRLGKYNYIKARKRFNQYLLGE